mmetsp:Transcript_9398/g.18059  ORF Transcript_9398/g.18059 Transcript_9398/m.18059 type:complete len:284 (+) Transcript_9398:3766-4617(+)
MISDSENDPTLSKPRPKETKRSFGRDLTNSSVSVIAWEDELEDYKKDILRNQLETERLSASLYGYIEQHLDITSRMRNILVNWLIEVHAKFELVEETIYLAVYLIDLYLSKNFVLKRSRLQLVGVACLMVASKYEDLYYPDIKDFVSVSDKAYSAQEILQQEIDLLRVINYSCSFPSPWYFLNVYKESEELSEEVFLLASYLLELTLLDYSFLRFKPSVIAASCVYLSKKQTKSAVSRPSSMVAQCSKQVCSVWLKAHTTRSAPYKKYSSSGKRGVAIEYKLQ